ncbi:hypothetical protein D9757_013145 [Collybiopsis confluens]|uniref:AIG1-type G domain-containing protein n=1 Tax=Collybiopsis confluens TaxID=2823264 RepID=A0A8H5GSQ2_9AGAR|nr:hypothetical protein D9757_013145 [Collybiopsis confluens]
MRLRLVLNLVHRKFNQDMRKALDNAKLKNAAMIAVMGATGSGKSTFINMASGTAEMVTSGGLESCTQTIQMSSLFQLGGQNVVLVDTPGFDDTNKSDADTLAVIGGHLAEAYKNGITLAGVLYLHRITDVRVTGVTARNLRVFNEIVGGKAMKNVFIVTTMWENLGSSGSNEEIERIGSQREKELESRKGFMGDAISKGAKIVRHRYNTKQSAQKVVLDLLAISDPTVLQLQKELVDDGKTLNQTGAGGELNKEMDKKLKEYQQEIEAIKADMRAREAAGNKQMDDLRREIEEANRARARIEQEKQRMQADYSEIKRRGQTGK